MKNASLQLKAHKQIILFVAVIILFGLMKKAEASIAIEDNPSGWKWSTQRELVERQLGISSELMPPISGVGPALIAAYNKRAGTNGIVSVPKVIQDSKMVEAYRAGEVECLLRIQRIKTGEKVGIWTKRLWYDSPKEMLVGYNLRKSPDGSFEGIYSMFNENRDAWINWTSWLQGNEAQAIMTKYGYGSTSWNARI